MKHLLAFALLLAASARAASVPNDLVLSQIKPDGTGPTERRVSPPALGVLGFGDDKRPVPIGLGSGLQLTQSGGAYTLAGLAGTWGGIGGTLSSQSDLASALAGKHPIKWRRYGTVLKATTVDDNGQVQEITVIREGSPQILNGSIAPGGLVYKAWYSAGYPIAHLSYAESYDGVKWEKYSGNPIISDHTRAFVLKVGGTYYMYALGSGGLDLLTSSNGVSFTLDTANVLTVGAPGAWDSNSIDNVCVLYEGVGVWTMTFEANNTVIYRLGKATSSNGRSWAKYSGNPTLSNSPGSVSSPSIVKQGSTYFMLAHVSSTGFLPSDIAMYSSTDGMVTWARSPAGLVLERTTPDEGEGSAFGQIADPHLLEVDGRVMLWYSSNNDGTNNTGRIGLVVADATLAELFHSAQGAYALEPKKLISGPDPLWESYQTMSYGSGDGDATGKRIATFLVRQGTNTTGNYDPMETWDYDASGASFGRNTEKNTWVSSASSPLFNMLKVSGLRGVQIFGKGLNVGGTAAVNAGDILASGGIALGGGASVGTDLAVTGGGSFGSNVAITGALHGILFNSGVTGSYSQYYSGVAPSYAIRLNLADDAANHRTYQIGYHTGNTQGGTWNTRFEVDGYTGDVSASGLVSASQFNGSGATLVNIPNAALVNSAIMIAGTSVSLGGSISRDTITGLSSTGIVKRTSANAYAIATSGTDYAPATSGSSILYGNGSGGFSNVTIGSALSFSTGTLSVDLDTSAKLRAYITDETGSGALVFATSPTFVTPNLGSASATDLGIAGAGHGIFFNGGAIGAGSYALYYSGVASSYSMRLALASDSTNQRIFEIGYHTGDLLANAWNSKFSINGYTGDVIAAGGIAAGSAGLTLNSTAHGYIYNDGAGGMYNTAGHHLGWNDIGGGGSALYTTTAERDWWLGHPDRRVLRGYFKQTGLTIGDGHNGPTISATGTSPNENLVVTTAGTGAFKINSNAIVLGGNFTTSGAFALTLTQTGTTNVTLPTSGTLATVAGTEVPLTFSTGLNRSTNTITVDQSFAPTWTGIHTHQKKVVLGSTQSAAAWTTAGIILSAPAASYTDTSSSGTVAVQSLVNIGVPTLLASSATTYTDSFTATIGGAPTASTNVTQTRAHAFGIQDSTSASSSVTGAFVVATTFGTSASSVGIGGGNINAGGNGTFGGTLSVTGHATLEGVTSTGAAGTGKFLFDTSPVILGPTIGNTSTATSPHITTVGTAPSVSATGLGSGGSPGVALDTGSTDMAGTITLTTGNSSVGSTGTITLTFNGAYVTHVPVIVATLTKGATDWGALATVRQTTESTTAPILTWNNSSTGTAVALSTGTTYKITYVVVQK